MPLTKDSPRPGSRRSSHKITTTARMGALGLLVVLTVIGGLGTAQAQTCFDWAEDSLTDPPLRRQHSLSYDSDQGLVVLFGGSETNDTWFWNGVSWSKLQSSSPPPRLDAALAYDEQNAVTVLFGGFILPVGPLGQDTWELSGGDWVEVNVQKNAVAPDPRHQHALVYDSVRNVAVLFGGSLGILDTPVAGDTWERDGDTWTNVATTGPPARRRHAMAFDKKRGVTVLFGGAFGSGELLADTWEWNGTSWTQVGTTGPSARKGHVMAYDEARGTIILFGGQEFDFVRLNDTWDWDGASWTPRAPKAFPPKRDRHAMAYDRARGEAVMFGGWNGSTQQPSTWTLSAGPPIISQQPGSAVAISGSSAGFGVTASGTGPISYQWRKNELPIENATDAFYQIGTAELDDAGSYDVVVTGPCDSITSDAATLDVFTGPDLNGDGRTDLFDYAILQAMLTGP